jgi:hypothetical protein
MTLIRKERRDGRGYWWQIITEDGHVHTFSNKAEALFFMRG